MDQIHEILRLELQRIGLKGVDAARQAGIDAQYDAYEVAPNALAATFKSLVASVY